MEWKGKFTQAEIYSQPEAWEGALGVLKYERDHLRQIWERDAYDQVIFTGCGSTYYLSLAAASFFQEMSGVTARALPASELCLSSQASFPKKGKVLLVATSRSGETSETVKACQVFLTRKQGSLVTLTCNPAAPLASLGEANLVFPSAAEKSVAQTRSFSTLYLGALWIADVWSYAEPELESLERLPALGRKLLNRVSPAASTLGGQANLERFYFLGSGPRYGLACELSLKMKEMSLSHSEPFHFLEFRHGPQSMVNENTLIVGLVSESNQDAEMAVLQEMRRRGARILSVGDSGTDVRFASGLDEHTWGPLYLPFGQMLAFERSIARELDPDHPEGLTAVVKLDNI